MIGMIEPPCGVPAHRMGRWDDVVLGIWWCPDCGEAIWTTEEDTDAAQSSGDPAGAGTVGASGSAAAAVSGLPGDAPEPGHAPRASRDRTPEDDRRVSDLHGRVWNLIFRTVAR